AVTVKWPSVVAGVPIALTAWLGDRGGRRWPPSRAQWVTLGLAGLISCVAAFLVAPYIFLDFGTVLVNVRQEARAEHLSATSPGFWSALAFYVVEAWSNAPVCLVLAPLAVLAFRAKNGQAGA